MLNKEKKKKLFDILIDFGFKKLKTDKHVYFNQFINDKEELLVFPKIAPLQEYHYIYARTHLDMNGWLDKNKFNELFDL